MKTQKLFRMVVGAGLALSLLGAGTLSGTAYADGPGPNRTSSRQDTAPDSGGRSPTVPIYQNPQLLGPYNDPNLPLGLGAYGGLSGALPPRFQIPMWGPPSFRNRAIPIGPDWP